MFWFHNVIAMDFFLFYIALFPSSFQFPCLSWPVLCSLSICSLSCMHGSVIPQKDVQRTLPNHCLCVFWCEAGIMQLHLYSAFRFGLSFNLMLIRRMTLSKGLLPTLFFKCLDFTPVNVHYFSYNKKYEKNVFMLGQCCVDSS